MSKIIPQVSQLAAKYLAAIVHFLILLVLSFSISSTSVAATEGYPLINTLTGAFGDATNFMKSEVDRLIEESGIKAAATQANDALTGFAEGAVPVIDDLANPYQEKAEDAVAKALDKVKIATDILNKITGPGAEAAIEYLRNSPLFAGADFGISTPTGRLRIKIQGTEISLCRTVVGPLGSVIITGFSNAKNLCHFPDPRMSNPTKSLIAFTYIAAGHTHIRTSHVIVPNLAEDLTKLPAPIDATTYIKTKGGQLVQIRLAGADPASITMDAKFEVGLKANVSYYIDLEAETEAALSITDLKPLVAAEVIRSTGAVMFNKATALGLDIKVANLSSDAAAILQAGLDHLSDIEGNFGDELADGFGNVSIDVKLTTGIGLGFLDTAISLLSANSTFNLTAPLAGFIEMSIETPSLLKEFLDSGLEMANVNMNLASAVLTGKDNALAGYKADLQAISDAFIAGPLTSLLELTTKITSIESTFKLALLGDADKQSITLYESGIELPIGVLSTSLLNNTNPIGGAFEAMTYLMYSAINPTQTIPAQTWTDLKQVVVPGIKFTLRARNPLTATLIGFKEADLLQTVTIAFTIRDILVGVITSSVSESLNDLREVIDMVVVDAIAASDGVLISWINNAKIERSIAIGTNASLGAEAVAEVGANLELKGQVSGSLFLLLANLDIYRKPIDPDYPDDPEKGGLLSSASMPIEFSLDAGASAGEGLEVTVDAGGQLKFNAFELTVKHWDGELPTAALMKVAGFSVIEFNGVTKADGSFSGPGYLMMPMGGIVSADFSVDEFGNVISGSWSGGLELGPLGNYPFIEGTIDNDGLHGTVNVGLLGSNFNANFIVHSSGLLFGSYDGSITIGSHELAAANIYLGTDGQFSGHYEGDIEIGGFAANSNLDFDNDGFSGSSNLNILGSTLASNDIVITRSGTVSGTFTGSIVVPGPHTLSAVSLRTINGGLIGTAIMDLPGAAGVEVNLQIINGKITATYSGDFMGGLASQASMVITNAGINLSASLNTSQLSTASSQAIQLLLDAAGIAQPLVDGAQILVGEMQVLFDIADLALKGVQSTIDGIQESYKDLIDAADLLVTTSQTALDTARGTLKYWNQKITDLDNWYNGLGTIAKKAAWLAYKADRAILVGSRNIAQTAFNAADAALVDAKAKLKQLKIDLDNAIAAVKQELQDKYDYASGELAKALNALDQLLKEISVLDMEPASIFSVQSMSFNADLSQLLSGNSFTANARLTFLGKQGQVNFTFNPSNLSASIETIVTALMAGDSQLSDSDKTSPIVLEISAAAQQEVLYAEENLLAAKNAMDSQITLLQGSYANLIFNMQLQLNDAKYLVNELEDAVAQASFFDKIILQAQLNIAKTALVIAQNALTALENELELKLISLNQSLQNAVNDANNQLSATQNYLDNLIAKSSNGQAEGVLIQLTATDNVAVASITYSASGAQIIPETTVAGDLASILIEVEGMTSLSFYATDISGNVSGITTMTTSVDRSAPQINVEMPTDASVKPYNVMITAQDLQGSGISYLAVSASGAEVITETIGWSGSTVVSLTTPGVTTLTITAVDEAGNITTLTKEVTVPELPDVNLPVDSTPPSEGGGALGLLWLLLASMMFGLRRAQMQLSHQ